MTWDEYFRYFETIASNHRSINHSLEEKHFFRTELDEAKNNLQQAAYWPLMLAEDPVMTSMGSSFANPRWQYIGGIMILQQIQDRGDHQKINEAKELCRGIADQIRAKMIKDRRDYDAAGKKYVLEGLDLESFTIESTPMEYFKTSVGMILTFRFNEPMAEFDQGQWNNENPASP